MTGWFIIKVKGEKMLKLFSVCLIVAGLTFFSFGYLTAEEAGIQKIEKEQNPDIKAEKQEPASPGEKKVVAKLAGQFKVEEHIIINLRTLGYGYGEISHALVTAEKSGKSLDEIVSLRNSGMGWGEIAKKYDLKLGRIEKDVKKIKKDIKKDLPPKAMEEKPAKMTKPEKEKSGRITNQEKPVKMEKPTKGSK